MHEHSCSASFCRHARQFAISFMHHPSKAQDHAREHVRHKSDHMSRMAVSAGPTHCAQRRHDCAPTPSTHPKNSFVPGDCPGSLAARSVDKRCADSVRSQTNAQRKSCVRLHNPDTETTQNGSRAARSTLAMFVHPVRSTAQLREVFGYIEIIGKTGACAHARLRHLPYTMHVHAMLNDF